MHEGRWEAGAEGRKSQGQPCTSDWEARREGWQHSRGPAAPARWGTAIRGGPVSQECPCCIGHGWELPWEAWISEVSSGPGGQLPSLEVGVRDLTAATSFWSRPAWSFPFSPPPDYRRRGQVTLTHVFVTGSWLLPCLHPFLWRSSPELTGVGVKEKLILLLPCRSQQRGDGKSGHEV